MNRTLKTFIEQNISHQKTENNRLRELTKIIDYIIDNIEKEEIPNNTLLNFVCTHNSRRSHLCQIWAQTMAYYFKIPNINCYSCGTQSTAVAGPVIAHLEKVGFEVINLSSGENPIYAIKFCSNGNSIISFSKTLETPFNPKENFMAVMTCSDAETNCPTIHGAKKTVSLKYEDPKIYDKTPQEEYAYFQTSLAIANEMYYIFTNIEKRLIS